MMTELRCEPCLWRGADRFDEWYRTPAACPPTDPRVEVRQAHPSEFDRIYDLVDEVFGVKRPRALYDWLYRRNPCGVARCWVVIERATDRLIASGATCPWPLARGGAPLSATLNVDFVIAKAWQRQRLAKVRFDVRDSHPLEQTTIRVGWPNAKSRGAHHKAGRDERLLGPIPRRVLPLKTTPYLTGRGWPQPLAIAADRLSDTALTAWATIALRRQRQFSGTVEVVRRFERAYDTVTERCVKWDRYWLPHDAAFLNWRYLEHPTRQYIPLAAVIGSAPVGYCVVQIDGHRAWLMELAAPLASPVAAVLLARAIAVAREAGCAFLAVCASPRWRHWPLVRSAGFIASPFDLFLYAWGRDRPDMYQLENWQFLTGDVDTL